MRNLRAEGALAEDRAADYLLSKGYTLISRRRKVAGGEIDLICLDGEILVFVEVKARKAKSFVPEDSIGGAKIGHLRAAARSWAESCGEDSRDWRFDLIAIDGDGLRHHIDVLGE